MNQASELIKKFEDGGLKDLSLATQAAELHRKLTTFIEDYVDKVLIRLKPSPALTQLANELITFSQSTYYQEFLKDGSPDYCISILLDTLPKFHQLNSIVGMVVGKEIMLINRLLSLFFQQRWQPLYALYYEVNVLRIVHSFEGHVMLVFRDILRLLDTFPKIDDQQAMRGQISKLIQLEREILQTASAPGVTPQIKQQLVAVFQQNVASVLQLFKQVQQQIEPILDPVFNRRTQQIYATLVTPKHKRRDDIIKGITTIQDMALKSLQS
jgi:hypothetical protein